MIDWVQVQEEYDEIVQKLTNTSLDRRTRGDLQRKASQMSQLLSRHKEINECQQTITENKELAEMETGELKELCEQEVIESEEKLKELNRELEDLLYPADDRDSCSVFLEISIGNLEGAVAISMIMVAIALAVLFLVRLIDGRKGGLYDIN